MFRPLLVAGLASAMLVQPVLAQTTGNATGSMKAVSPLLSDYTDKVVFADVWQRPILNGRDRSLLTVAMLVTTYSQGPLERHMTRGLNNGLKPAEVAGLITHLGFYAGWPAASNAVDVADKVFQQQHIDRSALLAAVPPLGEAMGAASRQAVVGADKLAPASPKLVDLADKVIYGDLWRRTDLTPRDRSLVSLATVITQGAFDQLPAHFRLALASGVTREQLGEVLVHLSLYVGWPKITTAAGILASTLPVTVEAGAPKASYPPMMVYHPDPNVAGEPSSHVTGKAKIDGPYALHGSPVLRSSAVTFEPGTRTRWHSHPYGQLLIVTSGTGWVQAEGQKVIKVVPGDVIWTAPNVKHWHGATRTSRMTHIAVAQLSVPLDTEWDRPTTEDEYQGPR